MTLVVCRPNTDSYIGSEVVLSTGSAAWPLLDDGGAVLDFNGADDTTYVRVNADNGGFTKGRIIVGLTNLVTPLTLSQRIKQVRLRGRVRMNISVPGFGATVTSTFRDPSSGLGRGGTVTAEADSPRDSWFTSNAATFQAKTGAWRTTPPTLDGSEWTEAVINRGQIECVWYPSESGGTNTNLRLSELYLDVDVRDQPTVTGVTVAGAGTTRPTVSWTYNANADGDRQIMFRVKVFTVAQYTAAAFNPETSTATWDSGSKFSSTTTYDLGGDLLNGATYRVYVKAGQDFNRAVWYSPWANSSAFTVALSPPPVPALAVTSDPSVPNLRNVFQFTAALNALSADDADVEVSAGNWIVGGGFSSVARTTAQHRNGVAALALTANGTVNPFAYNGGNGGVGAVATRPGQRHNLTGYVRANTTGRAWRLVLRWLDAAKNYLSQTDGTTATDTSGGWTPLAVAGTAPAGALWVLAQIEAAATPANGEVHYLDQVQLVPGDSAPAWSPGGLLGNATAVVEYAQVTGVSPNLATRQLYGGGDELLSPDGWWVTGTTSQLAYDMLDRVRGIGSIRWDIEDAASALTIGLPSGTFVDPDHPWGLPAVPGRTYGFSVYLRSGSAFTTQLSVQPVTALGVPVGAPTPTATFTLGDAWTRVAVWVTIPAGAAYVRPQVANSLGVVGRKVWADGVQWELGDPDVGVSALARPGGVAADWQPVRGFMAGKTLIPAGTQSLIAFDHEAPPGRTVTYRAWIQAIDPVSGQILSSAPTPSTQTLIDPPGRGIWVLSEVGPAPFLRGQVQVVGSISESQHEETTAYYPIRPGRAGQLGQRPVILTDYLGGWDATINLAALSDDDWELVSDLLAVQDVLWLVEPSGGARYIRVLDRQAARVRWRERCLPMADGTVLGGGQWERVLTLQFEEAERPPDNRAPVVFAVAPGTSIIEEPPAEAVVIVGDRGAAGEIFQVTQPGAPNLFDRGTGTDSLRAATVAAVLADRGTAADSLSVPAAPPPVDELVFAGAPTNWIDTSGGCSNAASTTVSGGVQHDFGTP